MSFIERTKNDSIKLLEKLLATVVEIKTIESLNLFYYIYYYKIFKKHERKSKIISSVTKKCCFRKLNILTSGETFVEPLFLNYNEYRNSGRRNIKLEKDFSLRFQTFLSTKKKTESF